MLEKSNAALIEAIHAHTPQHSNPASLLMDMLNIGREAAYRRLRGEVPFTFGEASALCARMHFSLDRVVGLAATDKLSFQLKFKEFTAPLETYNEILERDIAFMREVASDPTTEFATATNSLPAEFYGKYDNLNRFKLFKWLYQHEVGNPAVRTFEELKLPAELRRNCREYVRWVQSVATTYLIFDDSNFKHWLNALRAYREMHLISQESVRVLRDELFAMLDEMETVAVKGEFENGNKIFLYLSDIDLESSYSYVTTSRHQAVNIGMFSLNGLRTPDPLMYEYVKKWIKTQSRFSRNWYKRTPFQRANQDENRNNPKCDVLISCIERIIAAPVSIIGYSGRRRFDYRNERPPASGIRNAASARRRNEKTTKFCTGRDEVVKLLLLPRPRSYRLFPMEDERTLLEKLARGDRASFDALYMRYAAKTEEFLCRMLKNRAEAEDITHDLFLKIWQNRSTMAGVTAFGSYLFRMARNAVYDRFDSRAVRTNFARQTNLLPEYELPDVDNRDLLLLIQLAVEKMPGQRQRIFRMSREEGIANDEIARRLGISTRTVENQISRVLSELRKLVTLILFFF